MGLIDTNLQAAQNTLDSLNSENSTLSSTVTSLNSQVSSLQSQISAMSAPFVPKINGALHTGVAWTQNGNVGNSGGGSSVPHGTYSEVLDTNGAMRTFIVKPAYPYDNYYFSKHLSGPPAGKYRFIYHMQFQYRTLGDVAKSQAYEFEMQWSDTKNTFNMAWQCSLSTSNTWRYFHYTGTAGTGKWIDSKIPVDLTYLNSGAIMDVYASFLCDSATASTTHEYLMLNGKQNLVNVTQAAVAKGESSYLRVANQLDTKGSVLPAVPPSYSVSFACDEMHCVLTN